MVSIGEKFAKLRKLKFSTNLSPIKSKSKCLIFSKVKSAQDNVILIILNGDPLPRVDTVKYLGNMLESNNSMKRDCLAKRAKLIGKIHSLLREFRYCEPAVILRILNIYVTSFYGSYLWDLYSKEVVRIFSTCNATVKECLQTSLDYSQIPN